MLIDYTLMGKRLAEARKQQNLTQAKLAEKADIGSNYLSHIENSRSIPSLETLMTLCNVLNVTPNTLLMGADVTQHDYMVSDIEKKLAQCSEGEKRIVHNLIDVMLKEHKK